MTTRAPMITGWCGRGNPAVSHERCAGVYRFNPKKEATPCPCTECGHYGEDEYECGNCGGIVVEAPLWPPDPEFPDDPVYVHVDPKTRRVTGEVCP